MARGLDAGGLASVLECLAYLSAYLLALVALGEDRLDDAGAVGMPAYELEGLGVLALELVAGFAGRLLVALATLDAVADDVGVALHPFVVGGLRGSVDLGTQEALYVLEGVEVDASPCREGAHSLLALLWVALPCDVALHLLGEVEVFDEEASDVLGGSTLSDNTSEASLHHRLLLPYVLPYPGAEGETADLSALEGFERLEVVAVDGRPFVLCEAEGRPSLLRCRSALPGVTDGAWQEEG